MKVVFWRHSCFYFVGSCRRIWCSLEFLFHPCSCFYPYIHCQDSSKALWPSWSAYPCRYRHLQFGFILWWDYIAIILFLYKVHCCSLFQDTRFGYLLDWMSTSFLIKEVLTSSARIRKAFIAYLVTNIFYIVS